MQRAALFLLLTALPLMAGAAAPLEPGKHWHDCEQDVDCIAVQGICDLTAVNNVFKTEAIAYYKQQARMVRCKQTFWKPKDKIARCRLGWCETIANQPAK